MTRPQKTILLGMLNPHSLYSDDALHPTKYPNSAGSRLFEMAREAEEGLTEAEYLAAFDRRNVLHDSRWDMAMAKLTAPQVMASLVGRRVVMLGKFVPAALGLSVRGWFGEHELEDEGYGGVTYFVIPHPSGLNRLYNDRDRRQLAGGLLVGEMRRYVGSANN